MIVNCLYDGKPFEAKRKTAKFCTPEHRVAYARKNNIDEATGEIREQVKEVKVPEHPLPAAAKKAVADAKAYDREKNLQAFVKMGVADVEWIPTGLDDLDKLTMIPRGRITHIYGAKSVGKTTLCLNMIKGLRNRKVLYIDSEASLNPYLLVDLELDASRFHLYNESSYLEDIAEVVQAAAKSGEYELVIFDSLAACTTRAETEGKLTDRNIGQKAFFMHKLLHMTQMDFKNSNTAFVIINQERKSIGGYVQEIYTPGGSAVPFAASLEIRLKTTKSRRFPAAKPGAKKHMYEGHEVDAELVKSKVSQPHRIGSFKLFYPNPYEIEMTEEAQANVNPGKEAF